MGTGTGGSLEHLRCFVPGAPVLADDGPDREVDRGALLHRRIHVGDGILVAGHAHRHFQGVARLGGEASPLNVGNRL